MNIEKIKVPVRAFIESLVAANESSSIKDDTLLMTNGIIDSISTLKLVDFLEKEFGIEFQPHEVDKDNLNSIDLISNFVKSKLK